MMKNFRFSLRAVVILGSLAAALVLLILRLQADVAHIFGPFVAILMFFFFLGVIPLILIEMIFSRIAKSKGRVLNSAWVWTPGLIYIVFAAIAGWVMGENPASDPGGIAGLILFVLYLKYGALILAAALMGGIIGALKTTSEKRK